MLARQLDGFITLYRASRWHRAPLDHPIEHVGPRACYKVHPGCRPAFIKRIVEIPSVDDHNGTRSKLQLLSNPYVVGVSVGDQRPTGQTALMVQLQVQFDGALDPLKPRPVKYLNAQLNNRTVHASQRIFETEPPLFGDGQRLAALEQIFEHTLIELPRSMSVGVSQSRASRCLT